jgi:superfamily I DNA/RNA helicase
MQINGVRFENLNPIQQRIVFELDKRDRLAVIGGPGTGKTFIAIFAILKALESKQNSFFLVYNKNLNLYIKKLIGNEAFPEYLAKTYHSWLPGYLAQVLTGYTLSRVHQEFTIKGETFDYKWDLIEIELNKVHPDKRRKYDFLFLDEAQDMPLALLNIIKYASKRLMVTFDDSQKIGNDYFQSQKDQLFDRTEILNHLELSDSFFDLTENYRNTKSIEKVAKLFGEYFKPNDFSLKHETSKLKGPLPNLIKVNDKSQMVRLIYADYILHPQAQIGVVFANTRKPEDLERIISIKQEFITYLDPMSDAFFYKLGTESSIKSFDLPGIYFMSMNSAKGLEFDKVYLIELDHLVFDNEQQANLIYVACTRSRRHLTFLYETNEESPVLKVAFDHELLFNRFDASNNNSLQQDKDFIQMIEEIDDGE